MWGRTEESEESGGKVSRCEEGRGVRMRRDRDEKMERVDFVFTSGCCQVYK